MCSSKTIFLLKHLKKIPLLSENEVIFQKKYFKKKKVFFYHIGFFQENKYKRNLLSEQSFNWKIQVLPNFRVPLKNGIFKFFFFP